MTPVRVTFRRTIGMARTLYTTMLALAAFLSATAALLAFNLDAAEGCRVRFVPLWTVSVAPVLPILTALLGMETWSDERRTGRIDLLLASPVRERELMIGKFLGVWTMSMIDVLLALIATFAFVGMFAPSLLTDVSFFSFLPGLLSLALQGLLWSAVSVAASAFFRHSAAAACTSIVLLVAVPRGIWAALMAWAPSGRPRFGEMPLDAQVYDMASGLVSTATVMTYLLLTGGMLFLGSKIVALSRYGGRGAAKIRMSTLLSLALAAVFVLQAVALVYRLDLTLDIPVGGEAARFSASTRRVLAESQGSVTITAFLERKDPRFREVGQFLRALKAEADAQCGVRLDLRYVDPVLDIGAAQRLVRADIERDSLVFESDDRIVGHLRLADGYGERSCISLIERIFSPVKEQRNCIYWTTGHGEASVSDYGPDGLSSIARDLALDGYENRPLDLSASETVPGDCALVVIAGARNDFAVVEMNRLRSFLEASGGRLLVMMDSVQSGGLQPLLSEWGIRPVAASQVAPRTLTGSDVIVSDFSADHVVSFPLTGQQVVLDQPIAFVPSTAAEGQDVALAGKGATASDRKRYSELLRSGKDCLSAAVERGVETPDLALLPTRLVAIGDLGFVLNGQMRFYRNANRDFFLNSIKYLSGRDVLAESGASAEQLVSGMDRSTRARFAVVSAIVFPSVLFFVLAFVVSRRRARR